MPYKHLANQRKNQLRRYHKNRRRVHLYKILKGCKFCGYRKCSFALEFHHLRDKDGKITQKVASWSWKRLRKEIEKCEVLCANCHREVHRC